MIRKLLIVAHGQPSDPLPAAAELRGLAARIAGHLPGWQVHSATLAEADALERFAAQEAAAGQTEDPGLVFPVFMARGWFTQVALPGRLARAGVTGWQMMEPMGVMPALQALAVTLARESGADEVLLAAHGSGRSDAPAQVAREVVALIAAGTKARRVEAAFIEEPPLLSAVQGWGPKAICLPFFAMSGGHVVSDLPEALATAGFLGTILPPLGLDPRIPALIAAAALQAAADA
ncbi:cobalamin biosynthesis protein CbiX [Xinfangfangia sp. D13-10-4-6]|uniref:sirohydrochlorin chelatase n=1 Tax=Pseudogemmobacter hezensis TaxID=2737662 RepID=UPI00155564BE|nr:CbiX/SirB N-terminal domain-containing protein [Pseudogemmobacter hezensis]NPD15546.1 cobalamin biosynthesis protein CbiX [Pseudogemmobacter hezensis]